MARKTNPKGKGWHNDPYQHGLASMGVKIKTDEMNAKDKNRLRRAINAELEAINMYEEIADNTEDPRIEKVFRHIAEEEKHHIAEFGITLRGEDDEQLDADEKGLEEVREIFEDEDEEFIQKIRKQHDDVKEFVKNKYKVNEIAEK